MFINTAVLGQVDVDPDNIFHLSEGLYGFEREGDYALVTKQDEGVTLMWLQSVDGSVPCFVVFNPFEIIEGYDPQLEESDLRHLGVSSPKELTFLVIAVVPEDISQITVNLKSPIAVNMQSKKARQVILSNRDYPIRFCIFGEDEQPQAR